MEDAVIRSCVLKNGAPPLPPPPPEEVDVDDADMLPDLRLSRKSKWPGVRAELDERGLEGPIGCAAYA